MTGKGCSIVNHAGVTEPGTARVEMVAGATTLSAVAKGIYPGGQWNAHLDVPASVVLPGAYSVTARCVAVSSDGLSGTMFDYQPITYTVDPI